nr:MAG TPA: hypothetical protein [Caudoviricetes sp.]
MGIFAVFFKDTQQLERYKKGCNLLNYSLLS